MTRWFSKWPRHISSSPDMDTGKKVNQPKNIQKPQNHDDDYNGVQDRFDRARHRYEVVDEPEQNAHHDQGHQNL